MQEIGGSVCAAAADRVQAAEQRRGERRENVRPRPQKKDFCTFKPIKFRAKSKKRKKKTDDDEKEEEG